MASNFVELSLGHLISFTDILTKTQNTNMIATNGIDKFIVSKLDSLSVEELEGLRDLKHLKYLQDALN